MKLLDPFKMDCGQENFPLKIDWKSLKNWSEHMLPLSEKISNQTFNRIYLQFCSQGCIHKKNLHLHFQSVQSINSSNQVGAMNAITS